MRPFRPAAVLAALALSLAACVDDLPVDPRPVLNAGAPASAAARPDLITADPQAFADALRRVGNQNEVLVALKDPGAPRIGRPVFERMPLAAPLVVALPETPEDAPRRGRPGLARAGAAAHRGVLQALAALGVQPYARADWSPVMSLRIPDDRLVPVLAVLLRHPAVDYVEANQRRPVAMDAGPLGANGYDPKHTFHNVLAAWDQTRGAGVRVGVMDSGMAFDLGTGQPHPDLQPLGAAQGVQARGFVDDYDNQNNCDVTGAQPYGNCVVWDDDGHGTWMVGLVGANDNGTGYVGVMPQGLTVSMKVAMNCSIAINRCGSDTWFLEDDDFYWGIRYASNNGIKVLSMSFSGAQGSSTYNALYDAYYTYDILLLSSTGNKPDEGREPQSYSFVMGVGGLYSSGASYGNNEYEDVSGYAGGATTRAYCSDTWFCSPSGYTYFGSGGGGTSAATANVAGIAGLVRAYNPGLTAAQTWDRLRATADASQSYRVDAYRAVLNIRPLSAGIDGPHAVESGATNTWTAVGQYGTPGYTYEWYQDGYWVGSGSTYTATLWFNTQLRVDATDAAGAVASGYLYVTVNCVQEPNAPECPI